jgi:hypothetical protein
VVVLRLESDLGEPALVHRVDHLLDGVAVERLPVVELDVGSYRDVPLGEVGVARPLVGQPRLGLAVGVDHGERLEEAGAHEAAGVGPLVHDRVPAVGLGRHRDHELAPALRLAVGGEGVAERPARLGRRAGAR